MTRAAAISVILVTWGVSAVFLLAILVVPLALHVVGVIP